MKDGQWYTISGWMGNRLELRGNDLICFAVIYGFSMDGESQFKGNLNYLTRCMFATRPTALLSLKHLLECNLILKQEELINGKKHCYYATNVIYDEGKFNVVDSDKEPLTMTSKEPLSVTNKESLPKNNNNKEQYNKEEKRLSNDNQKNKYSEEFEHFWKLYDYVKGKQKAYAKWNKLSDADKQKAVDAIPAYKEDCARCKRDMQHAATYLYNHTFEDDFSAKPRRAFYDAIEGDSEQKTKFKAWMRNTFPEIEDTALPLSFEDYMQLIKGGHIEDVTNALTEIHSEIYKYRKADIAQVVKSMIPNDEEDEQ